jgi:hypothetical protein
MSQAKHTPGPWQVKQLSGNELYIMDKEQAVICEFHTAYNTDEANAQLIAAAPELLDCADAPDLDAAHDMLSELLEDGNASNDDIREAAIDLCAVLVRHHEKRHAAIAKVKAEDQ